MSIETLLCYDESKPRTEIDMEQRDNANLFNRILEILTPFLIYYVICHVAFYIFISLCNPSSVFLPAGLREYIAEHAGDVTQLVNSVSMIIAVLPLIPMLRRELSAGMEHNAEMTGDKKIIGNAVRILSVFFAVILAASSSLGFNVLLAITGFVQTSAAYQEVAEQQYSIMFGMGAVLFGLISPVTEEIVFRGLVFNRIRRYYPTAAAVIASGVLFGVYHGNLVQGVYGSCMGILLAYVYARMHSLLIPCLFHATANFVVYALAQNEEQHARIFNVTGCVILLTISTICIFLIEIFRKKLHNR